MFERTCKCGTVFQTNSVRQTNCGSGCRKGKTHHPLTHTYFIALDGEGVTLHDGTHRYVLLSCNGKSISDEKGLAWDAIFSFLYEQYREHPDATFIGYYLGYDFTQWFKTLPFNRASILLTDEGRELRRRRNSGGNPTPFPVHCEQWDFDYLPNKRVKIKPRDLNGDGGWMYINDGGSYFQSPFLKAIDPDKWPEPIVSKDEYETIKEGKEHRAIATFDPAMVRYNLLENTVAERLFQRLADGFKGIGIALDRSHWFGPGQVASQWLKTTSCPTLKEVQELVPDYVRDIARSTYYGGWFEIFRHGTIQGQVWQYDINSAYPFQIERLPCIRHGRWVLYEGRGPRNDNRLRACFARVQGKRDILIGPLPYRNDKGWVLRPQYTEGWYWWDELQAAKEAGLVESFKIRDTLVFSRHCKCDNPLRAIRDLYQYRLEVGKNSPAGIAAKIGYNSVYGKLAQSVGDPRYGNALYASLITSGCRSQILRSISSHPGKSGSVAMVATDGIVFTEPHPSLSISTRLGEWDKGSSSNLSLAMPGIYWDDNSRLRISEDKAPELKSRGISARFLASAIGQLDEQFARFNPQVDEWPKAGIPYDFSMVTALQALRRGNWGLAGTVSNGTRILDTNPASKRSPKVFESDRGSWISRPYAIMQPTESVPYERRFGDELRDSQSEDALTPDGEVQGLIAAALKGDN